MKLIIRNYRCFDSLEIDFKDLSIIVGKNNSGKSTLIEVLRIVSILVNRASSINYVTPPAWIKGKKMDFVGIMPSIENLDISTKNIFYLYGNQPAIVNVFFNNDVRLDIYIGENAKIFGVFFTKEGINVGSKNFAASLKLTPINVLPQISPLLREESIIKYSTVQRNLDTNLSSRNFRNQLKYYYKYFAQFKELSEETWYGLSIEELENREAFDGEIFLLVRDNNFVAEIGWMGHGLQMWLQTMWFLSKSSKDSIIILDEPDVYMHADLQRRLIRLIKNNYNQIIIATHSIEIIAEVEPDNILPILPGVKKLIYANKAPIVQNIIEKIGSIHNIEITRLFAHKVFLIVEGDIDDTKILGILQGKIFPNTLEPIDILPKTHIEGWGGWQRVIGSAKVFTDNNAHIVTYCILDSDYHLGDELMARYGEAKSHNFNLHIWQKKEIENYLLKTQPILRIIQKEKKKGILPTLTQIENKLTEIVEYFKDEVIDNYASEIKERNKSLSVKSANQQSRDMVKSIWEKRNLDLIPGKAAIAQLSEWTHKEFKVNLNAFKIAREFFQNEIEPEVKMVIEKIENKAEF